MRSVSRFALVLCLSYGVSAQTLVFHNTMGGPAEIASSAVGPAFIPAPANSYAPGTPVFVPGVDGNATTLGPPLPPFTGVPQRLFRLPNTVLNPEHGTVEVVFNMLVAPNPNGGGYNYANLFDGPYYEESGFFLSIGDPYYNHTARLQFNLYDGAGTSGAQAWSLNDGLYGYNLTGQAGTWLHAKAMWDRAGIAGTSDVVRLYVNDQLVAAGGVIGSSWCTSWLYPTFKIGGCSGSGQGAYAIDDLKVWAEALDNVGPPVGSFALTLLPLAGGGASVGHAYGGPFDFGLTAFSFDPANAGAGFGQGWMAGLHIGLGELLFQWSLPVQPFFCPFDATGASLCVVPADVAALFSGLTVYAVALDVVPSTLAVVDVSPPTLLTLP